MQGLEGCEPARARDMREIIQSLQAGVHERKYRLTSHAEREREADPITVQEIEEAVLSEVCDLLEDYPTDPRGHSCFILRLDARRAPHSYSLWTSARRGIYCDHDLSP
jgi:hypothetical protein